MLGNFVDFVLTSKYADARQRGDREERERRVKGAIVASHESRGCRRSRAEGEVRGKRRGERILGDTHGNKRYSFLPLEQETDRTAAA